MSADRPGCGQTAGQDVPVDLVSVREAARAVGVTAGAAHTWIARGWLPAHTSPHGRLVSLSAVRALCAAPDPQAPVEALLVAVAAQVVGLPKWHVKAWARRGLLPSWHGHYGRLVLVEDVRAIAQHHAALLSAAEAATPLPADALLIRDAALQAGVSRGCIYTWMKTSLLPVWLGTGTGQRVRLADVVALAERPGWTLPPHPEREL